MDWYCLPTVMKAIRDGSINPKDDTCIREAIIRGNEELFDFIMAFEPNIRKYDEQGNTLLHVAVKHGNPYMFEKVIALGFDVNEKNRDGMTPIMIASKIASTPCVEELLKLGADPSIRSGDMNVFTVGWTPAVYSIFYRLGMSIRSYTDKPIHLLANLTICSKTQDPMVIEWIERVLPYYDINEKDDMGETPLHKTMTKRENRRVTEFLLARGANPNVQNRAGQTPLMKALLDKDRFWMTPLAERERVMTPLMNNLDLTVRDNNGNGYIMYMIKNNYILDIFDRLVKTHLQHADLTWLDMDETGKSILDIVMDHQKARRAVKAQIKKRIKNSTNA